MDAHPGARPALSELYRRYGAVVRRRARQITGSDDEAQEVLQELFRTLVETPQALDEVREPVAWLYRATTHMCLNRIRNRKNRERILREQGEAPEAREGDAEAATVVKQALQGLPENLAVAFVYYYLDQMTHAEIATMLGCSRRQVGYLLEQAHAHLERLKREVQDG